jgi:carboxymethylenebutenolidase
MGKMIRLKAKDGHELDAYLAEPNGMPKGGLVVVQEIFGVTNHIKRVADQYAARGYTVVAPAMFDRVERGVTLDYSEIEKGREYMRKLQWPNTLADVEAAASKVRATGSVSVVGYCWGGTVAHVAANELPLDAVVSYYGGGVAKMLDKKPRLRRCRARFQLRRARKLQRGGRRGRVRAFARFRARADALSRYYPT